MKRMISQAVLVAMLLLPLASATRGAEALTLEQFKQVRALVKPDPDEEKWAQIPWLSSLWEARKQAAKEGKPILLWEMDGHPLGCT
jgi:cell division protein FtsN